MTMDLDKLEAIARAAQESFPEQESLDWYNGGWGEPAVTPDEVLALIAALKQARTDINHVLRMARELANPPQRAIDNPKFRRAMEQRYKP